MKAEITGKRIAQSIIFIICLTSIDQITKWAAAKNLAGEPFVLIPGVLELRYLENTGAAFGILQNSQWFFILLTAVFLFIAGLFYFKIPAEKKYRALRLVVLFITSGALGNFIDRIMIGHVRDFIYFSLIDFPIFNVADIYITLSAAAAFILVIFIYKGSDFDFLKSPDNKEKETKDE